MINLLFAFDRGTHESFSHNKQLTAHALIHLLSILIRDVVLPQTRGSHGPLNQPSHLLL